MASSNKNGKMQSSASDALYDLEISRQAKEAYQVFSKKVMEDSASTNAQIHYPIHWLLTPRSEEKTIKNRYSPTVQFEDATVAAAQSSQTEQASLQSIVESLI